MNELECKDILSKVFSIRKVLINFNNGIEGNLGEYYEKASIAIANLYFSGTEEFRKFIDRIINENEQTDYKYSIGDRVLFISSDREQNGVITDLSTLGYVITTNDSLTVTVKEKNVIRKMRKYGKRCKKNGENN